MKSFFINWSKILLITVGLFTALELFIRIVAPQEVRSIYKNDACVALEDSVLGHIFRPNAHAMVAGPEYSVEYKINKVGMRDESVHSLNDSSNTLRVLLLGDSFTFGAANDYPKIWPVIFENSLRNNGYSVDVVKAGISAFDTRREVLYLKRLCPVYKPDIVVLAFLPNDLFTNSPIANVHETSSAPVKGRYDPSVRTSDDRAVPLHLVAFAKSRLLSNDYLYTKLYFLTKRARYFTTPISDLLEQQIDITKDLLLEAADYCKQRDVEFIVLSIPQQVQVLINSNTADSGDLDVNYIDQVFLEYAKENRFVWIPMLQTLSGYYRSNKEDLYFRVDGHLNNLGNRVVGEYFADEFATSVKMRQ